jgi:hypothetical protein
MHGPVTVSGPNDRSADMGLKTFGITYDYLCPFARNGNEHVVTGIRSGADWDVTFSPLSLTQLKAAESGEPRWDGSGALRRSGVLALAVAELVRLQAPDLFLDVHLELFALRHDRGEDLRDPSSVAGALRRSGADPALVDAAEDGLAPLRAAHEALVAKEVWGVPTLLGSRRAVFIRLLDRPSGSGAASADRIERLVELLEGEPMLHEFKQVDLPV